MASIMLMSSNKVVVCILCLTSLAVLVQCEFSTKNLAASDSETPSDGEVFYNSGKSKKYKDLSGKLENSVIKSKLQVLGEIFTKHISYLRSISNKQVELVFLVDASSSVGAENFDSELKFVRKLLSDFTVSQDATRVAVITFSSKDQVIRHVDHISQPSENNHKCGLLHLELPRIKYTGGGTYTLGALLEAQEVLRYARPSAVKAVFLVTDGFSNGGDPTPVANALKQSGVIIFTFGIDTGNTRELFHVASSPGHEYSYILDTFAEFAALARRALHQDLKSGVYQPLSDSGACDGLCPRGSGGSCCDETAHCACGTDTGHFSCVCAPGHFGTGLVGTCHPCPNGTYSEENLPGDSTTCQPCPDPNHVTLVAATSPDHCVCKAGFRQTGTSCQAVTCPRLSPPPDGHYVRKTCANVLHAACGARCDVGFTLTGSSIRLCQEDGTWSGQEARCQLKTCPPLVAPVNGTMNCSRQDNAVDAECSFACPQTHLLVGSRKRTCLPLGRWDGLPAACKPMTCPALAPPMHGTVKPVECSSGKRPYGSQCHIECGHGYTLKGPTKRTCGGVGGVWTGKQAFTQCLDLTPPEVQCPQNINTVANLGKSYASVTWDVPKATDNSDKEPTMWTKPAIKLPMKFKIGTTKITYVAADASRNKARCSFNVTVRDDQPPSVMGCEAPPTFLTNAGGNVSLSWDEPTFTDNSENDVKVERTPAEGHLFAYGSTEVSYIATDTSGNLAFCVINITVQENICHPPTDPTNGHAVCAEHSDTLHCTMTCTEGYGFAIAPRDYFCAYEPETDTLFAPDTSVDPMPDCSLSVLPNVITEQGTVSLQSDSDDCSDSGLINQIAADVTTRLTDAIATSCDNDVACYVANVTSACDAVLSANEEGTNAIGRRRRMAPRTTYVVEPKVSGSNIEVHFQMIGERKDAGNPVSAVSKAKSSLETLANQEAGSFSKRRKLRVKKLGFRADPLLGCPSGAVQRGSLCVQCPVGTFFSVEGSVCQSCPIGTFQANEGQTNCTACLLGSSTRKIHARHSGECKPICGAGWFGKQRRLTKDAVAVAPCLPCPIGTYQPSSGQRDCINCPSGTTTAKRATATVQACLEVLTTGCQFAGGAECLPLDPCLSGPCQNGATCRNEGGLLECDCQLGYYGSFCELPVPACGSAPCLNGGSCRDIGNASFNCTCPSGYSGSQCQTEVDECASNPCLNEGVCVDLIDGFACFGCADGFTGFRCEVDIDDCVGEPCLNGGTCHDQANGFSCSCADSFSGRHCEDRGIDPCDAEPCLNGGVCLANGSADFTCLCSPGYSGAVCDVTPCSSGPCLNGGLCSHHQTTIHCVCAQGFGGNRCGTSFPTEFVLRFPVAGTTDYVAVRGPPTPLDEVSVCLWLKSEDRFNYGTVFSYATESSDNTFTLTDYNGFVLYVNGARTVTDVSVNDGRWRSVCVEWRSVRGEWRILADGIERDSGSGLAAGSVIGANGSLVLGQEQDRLGGGFSQSESFTGLLSELSVWNRWRSEAQLEELASACGRRHDGNVFAWSSFLEGIRGTLEVEESSFCSGCPPLPPAVHANVTYHGNGTGATASFACSDGFVARDGAVIRRCGKHGEWDGSAPICQRVSCGFPGYFLHGSVSGSSYRYGDRITYQCHPGYQLVGKTWRTCGNDGRWTGDAPRCQGRSCGRPQPPPNGFPARLVDGDEERAYDDSDVAWSGHQVEFECREGFTMSGEAVSTCQDSGQWDYPSGECRPIECEVLKSLDNGTLTLRNVDPFSGVPVVGSEATAQCNAGFQLVGPTTRVCLHSGVWSSVASACVSVRCDLDRVPFRAAAFAAVGDFRLEIFENDMGNGVFSATGNGFGDVASFRCRPGYRLPGAAQDNATLRWTCGADGWIGEDDTDGATADESLCLPEGGNCTRPQLPDNAYTPEPESATSTSIGSTLELRCRLGYILDGPDRLTCQPNGTWANAGLTTCHPVECRRLAAPLHTVDLGDGATIGVYGNLVTFRCLDGYQAFADLSARCQANGRWSRVRGKCTRISCGKPAVSGGATVVGLSYLFQDRVVYQCPPGSKIRGAPVLTCSKDGTWEGNAACFPA